MKLPIAVLASLGLAGLASAEPSPTIKYLLGHEPTMMDLGLLRLQGALERMVRLDAEFELQGQRPSVVDFYDPDANQIRIEFMDALPKQNAITAPEWEQLCRARMARLRALFKGDRTAPGIAAQFGHVGWADPNRPFTLDAEIRDITYVRMYAQFADAKLECRGQLAGTDVFVPPR